MCTVSNDFMFAASARPRESADFDVALSGERDGEYGVCGPVHRPVAAGSAIKRKFAESAISLCALLDTS